MTGPDLKELAEGLMSAGVYRVLTFDKVGSTQTKAVQLGNAGEPEITVVLAKTQTQGRGRGRHTWFSPVGGLYASLILRPMAPKQEWPNLTIIAGYSVVKALRDMGIHAGMKWPNDVMVNGKKVGGCLAQAFPEQGFVVLGIGVNLDWNLTDIPMDLKERAGTIMGFAQTSPTGCSTGILLAVIDAYKLGLSLPVHRINEVLDRDNTYIFNNLQGKQVGITQDGSLKIATLNGNRILGIEYAAGD